MTISFGFHNKATGKISPLPGVGVSRAARFNVLFEAPHPVCTKPFTRQGARSIENNLNREIYQAGLIFP